MRAKSKLPTRSITSPASRNPTTWSGPNTGIRSSEFSTIIALPPVGKPLAPMVVSSPSRSRANPRTVESPPAKNRSLAGSVWMKVSSATSRSSGSPWSFSTRVDAWRSVVV